MLPDLEIPYSVFVHVLYSFMVGMVGWEVNRWEMPAADEIIFCGWHLCRKQLVVSVSVYLVASTGLWIYAHSAGSIVIMITALMLSYAYVILSLNYMYHWIRSEV